MSAAQQQVTVEVVAEMMKGMQANTLQMVADLVKEMKKPYVDEAWLAREKREASKTKRDMEQKNRIIAESQKRCSHKYRKSGVWAISTVHNHPDRQTRGHCNLCRLDIEPQHWEIQYDPNNIEGKAVLVPEHPQYHIVREIEAETAYQLVG